MQIVINIPKEFDASLVVDEMRNSIANGTPLPKGHGNKRKTMTREEAIKQLKKLKSFHNGSYGEAINFAIESIKVDMAYDLAYEKAESDREKVIKIIDKTIKDFHECEGGESWLYIDGEKYFTDVGYAFEGMEIFVEVLKKRLTESEDEYGNNI